MPDVQNVFRRGGAYWWRRTLRWLDGNARPITLAMSLGTKDLGVARHRAAAMTSQSEVVRMSLYERIARDGLTVEQRDAVLRSEMRAYRDALEHLAAAWQGDPAWAKVTDVDADLQVYEAIWGALAKTGMTFDRAPSLSYAEQHLADLTEEQRSGVRRLLGSLNMRESLARETAQRLEALGIQPNPTNMALATRIVVDARAQAARELRLGVDSAGVVPPQSVSAVPAKPMPEQRTPPVQVGTMEPIHIPDVWRTATPLEAAELLIRSNPAMLQHRAEGKRAATQVGEQTLRQIRWAATLLQKSMNPGGPASGIRPFRTITYEDIVILDRWFDKLPVTCGKSPWDRKPETTLQDICDRAIDRIDAGELEADAIGLDGVTTNKHLRKLKQIHDLAREAIDSLPEIRFAKFIVPDLKDERDARDAYTIEQAVEIFSLPPWTGCAGLDDRLSLGTCVFHDSLYFVLLLVWYTGMRREEVCKLLVDDVQCDSGYWFISIRNSEAGRVKNASSVRLIALSDELIRLGFIKYVEAIPGERPAIERRIGVLFQSGALFSALTVQQNVEAPFREHVDLPDGFVRDLAALKIKLAGLPDDAGAKDPSELSGGMRRRAGLARAIALDPDLLFLDEPTAGLDPIAAAEFDTLIRGLRDAMGMTVFMITHDLDSIYANCDRVAVLADRRIVAVAPVADLETCEQPQVREYFGGQRGRAVQGRSR